MSQTITRAALVECAVKKIGLSRTDIAAISDQMFDQVRDALMNAETVKLTGFGSLQVRERAERIGRNPRTGTTHRILPRYAVVFTPSAQLRAALDQAMRTQGEDAEPIRRSA